MSDYEEHLNRIFEVKRVVFAFAGATQDRYQFGRFLNNMNIPHVLFRDRTQHYHGNGVHGLGDGSRQAVIDYIAGFCNAGNYAYTLGLSSGAYAALLYGQLVPVNEIIAISPLTTRNECEDFPEADQKNIVDPSMATMDDLRKHYCPKGPIPKVRAYISDGPHTQLDRQMATRILIDDITLVSGCTHGELAARMRDNGMLAELLR